MPFLSLCSRFHFSCHSTRRILSNVTAHQPSSIVKPALLREKSVISFRMSRTRTSKRYGRCKCIICFSMQIRTYCSLIQSTLLFYSAIKAPPGYCSRMSLWQPRCGQSAYTPIHCSLPVSIRRRVPCILVQWIVQHCSQ